LARLGRTRRRRSSLSNEVRVSLDPDPDEIFDSMGSLEDAPRTTISAKSGNDARRRRSAGEVGGSIFNIGNTRREL
jgi:hypothetical protein